MERTEPDSLYAAFAMRERMLFQFAAMTEAQKSAVSEAAQLIRSEKPGR